LEKPVENMISGGSDIELKSHLIKRIVRLLSVKYKLLLNSPEAH